GCRQGGAIEQRSQRQPSCRRQRTRVRVAAELRVAESSGSRDSEELVSPWRIFCPSTADSRFVWQPEHRQRLSRGRVVSPLCRSSNSAVRSRRGGWPSHHPSLGGHWVWLRTCWAPHIVRMT